jgi:nuclear transport factor 2 (NTF2) superfamily protein
LYFHGNEHWEFDDDGYMRRRDASINDYKIDESERRYRWER